MSNLPSVKMSAVESALVRNDISKLTSEEKMAYVDALCFSVGLNKLTKPFAFLTLQGREVVYATKDCSEQLRKIHGVSTQIVSQKIEGDCFEVHIKAQDRTGRTDEDFASIPLKGLSGEALSNLKMKCITKAKRRVTLSICGLGILDESELDTIAKEMKTMSSNPQIDNPLKQSPPQNSDLFELAKSICHPGVADIPEVFKDVDYGEYVIQVGKKLNGQKLKDCDIMQLQQYVNWVEEKVKPAKGHYDNFAEFMEHAIPYLDSMDRSMPEEPV